jgi:hypothetical protein
MDKGSQNSLQLHRMPYGGFVVRSANREMGYDSGPLFASAAIDDCLRFMRDAILPVGGALAGEKAGVTTGMSENGVG